MAEVAQALGVSRQAYWKYEAGEIVPSDEMKVKIAQYFHVSVNMMKVKIAQYFHVSVNMIFFTS